MLMLYFRGILSVSSDE